MTNEAQILENDIVNWLDRHGNKITLDINKGSLCQLTPTIYSQSTEETAISIGFKEPLNKDTVDLAGLRENFNYIALDKLPLIGLTTPTDWQVYPQTPMSSFDEGVSFDAYENGRLRMTIITRFFAIYGRKKQEYVIMDKPADEGTYLQVRRDIEGLIKLDLPLVI